MRKPERQQGLRIGNGRLFWTEDGRSFYCVTRDDPDKSVWIESFTDLTGTVVHQGYGLTEASPVVTSTPTDMRSSHTVIHTSPTYIIDTITESVRLHASVRFG